MEKSPRPRHAIVSDSASPVSMAACVCESGKVAVAFSRSLLTPSHVTESAVQSFFSFKLFDSATPSLFRPRGTLRAARWARASGTTPRAGCSAPAAAAAAGSSSERRRRAIHSPTTSASGYDSGAKRRSPAGGGREEPRHPLLRPRREPGSRAPRRRRPHRRSPRASPARRRPRRPSARSTTTPSTRRPNPRPRPPPRLLKTSSASARSPPRSPRRWRKPPATETATIPSPRAAQRDPTGSSP